MLGCIITGRGIVRFWEGWCGARDGCAFERFAGIERFGATGGASPSPYEKYYVIMQMQNHTSAHSPFPTKSECDSAYAKPTERSLKGKGVGAKQGIVRF